MSTVFDYSTNPALNNSATPFGWPEGMNPADVNDTARQMQAAIAAFLQGLPWLNLGKPYTLVRNSNSQFQYNAIDLTAFYTLNRRVRMIGSTTAYGVITSSSLVAGNTVVNVLVDSAGSVPAALSEVDVCVLTDIAGFLLTASLPPSPLGGAGVRDGSFESGMLSGLQLASGGGTWAITGNSDAGVDALSFSCSGQVAAASARLNGGASSSAVGQIVCARDTALQMKARIEYRGTAPGAAFVQLGLEWRSAAGAVLRTDLATAIQPANAYGWFRAVFTGAPGGAAYGVPILQVNTGSPAGTNYDFDDVDIRVLPRLITVPTVASAAALPLDTEPDVFFVSGAVNVTSVTGGWDSRRVTLVFQGALTFTNGGNLVLNGNFTTAANSTITLVFASGNWYEVARKP